MVLLPGSDFRGWSRISIKFEILESSILELQGRYIKFLFQIDTVENIFQINFHKGQYKVGKFNYEPIFQSSKKNVQKQEQIEYI